MQGFLDVRMRYPETWWDEEHDYIAFASASFRRVKTQKTFRGLPRLLSDTIFQVLWHNPAYHYDLIISSSCRWRTIKSITKPVKFQIHSKHPFYHSMQRNWHQVLPPVQLHHDKRIHFGKDISKCCGFPSLDPEIATQKGMGRKPFPKPRFHPCPCWQDSKSFSMKVAIPCGNWSFTGQLRSFKRLPWLHVLSRKGQQTPHVLLILSRILTRVRDLTMLDMESETFPLAHIIKLANFPQICRDCPVPKKETSPFPKSAVLRAQRKWDSGLPKRNSTCQLRW